MNKILVSKNKITSDYDNVVVDGNDIIFNTDGEYFVEYIDIGKCKINYVINACVKLYETSFRNDITVNNRYVIDGGCLDVVKFYNNSNVSEVINIDLCRDGDKINYSFVNICTREERYTININHKSKDTSSNIVNKSIACAKSVVHFAVNRRV